MWTIWGKNPDILEFHLILELQIGFIETIFDNLFNYCSTLSDGKIEVSFQGTFQKQSIQAVGLRYCYCVGFNNESSNITNEYVYDAYNVDENNLRKFQKTDIPGIKYDLSCIAITFLLPCIYRIWEQEQFI